MAFPLEAKANIVTPLPPTHTHTLTHTHTHTNRLITRQTHVIDSYTHMVIITQTHKHR